MKLTHRILKEKLELDPNTGVFIRKKPSQNGLKIGSVAGTKRKDGYIQINISGKLFLAHRLVFLYIEGYFPEYDIDHINRIRDDNRWNNLRHVSHICNTRNRELQSNNKSGVTGVYFDKSRNKWLVQITINRKNLHVGIFKKKTKAVYYRWKAEIKHNFPNCNSTSSAYLYLKNKGLIIKKDKNKI